MKPFKCILADPPWPFRDQGSRIAPQHSGHYEVMLLSAIAGLGDFVREVSAKNAHLWLCVPNALVLDGTGAMIVQLWGFRPKQLITGVKNRIGMGHWCRNTTEQVILGVRGTLAALKPKNVPTHFDFPVREHSAKPDELYALVQRVSPGPRLEMFARRARKGWSSWGKEAPKTTRIPTGGKR